MASISAHQRLGGSIWFFGVAGYDEASYATLQAISPLLRGSQGDAAVLRDPRHT